MYTSLNACEFVIPCLLILRFKEISLEQFSREKSSPMIRLNLLASFRLQTSIFI